jgi:hypothetical protein
MVISKKSDRFTKNKSLKGPARLFSFKNVVVFYFFCL